MLCARCSCLLTPVWSSAADGWQYEDWLGRTSQREPWADQLEADYADVRARMLTKPPTASDAEAAWYSLTRASLDLCWLQLWHIHWPESIDGPTMREPGPECCAMPMQWTGLGWRCRVAGTVIEIEQRKSGNVT